MAERAWLRVDAVLEPHEELRYDLRARNGSKHVERALPVESRGGTDEPTLHRFCTAHDVHRQSKHFRTPPRRTRQVGRHVSLGGVLLTAECACADPQNGSSIGSPQRRKRAHQVQQRSKGDAIQDGVVDFLRTAGLGAQSPCAAQNQPGSTVRVRLEVGRFADGGWRQSLGANVGTCMQQYRSAVVRMRTSVVQIWTPCQASIGCQRTLRERADVRPTGQGFSRQRCLGPQSADT